MSVNGEDVTWDNLESILKALMFQRQVDQSLVFHNTKCQA